MTAEVVESAGPVALRDDESARLQRHARAAFAATHRGLGDGTGHALAVEDAEQLWQAAIGILATLGNAQGRPAAPLDNVVDLDRERAHRRY